MRELLFRGKRADNGAWVQGGSLIQFSDAGVRQWYIAPVGEKCITQEDAEGNLLSFDSGTFYMINPLSMGQYTGAKDISGVQIFEGDIISFTVFDYSGINTPHIGIVVFTNGEWEIRLEIGTEHHGYKDAYHLFLVLGKDDEVRIVGNIHDNPELKKEQHHAIWG